MPSGADVPKRASEGSNATGAETAVRADVSKLAMEGSGIEVIKSYLDEKGYRMYRKALPELLGYIEKKKRRNYAESSYITENISG